MFTFLLDFYSFRLYIVKYKEKRSEKTNIYR